MYKDNNNHKRRKLYYILITLICICIFLSVAYAALSTTLNINFGTVYQDAQTWNVGFESNNSISATKGGFGNTGKSCGTASTNQNVATVNNVNLSKPGDSCMWALKILNSGTINAKLTSIVANYPTTDDTCSTVSNSKVVCGNITYKITTDNTGNNLLALNEVINSNSYKYVYLYAVYTGTDIHSNEILQSGTSFSLVFTQN